MPKLGSNKFDKECPICGGIIWGKGQRVLLEGTKITVCQNCAQHGVKLHEPLLNRSKKKTTSIHYIKVNFCVFETFIKIVRYPTGT